MPSDDHLTIREVNEVLLAAGLDPEEVRAFARELVAQELTAGLSELPASCRSQRCLIVRDAITYLMDLLLDANVDSMQIASALETAADDLRSIRYSPVCLLPSMDSRRRQRITRFAEFAKRRGLNDETDSAAGPVQEDEGKPVSDDPGDGP